MINKLVCFTVCRDNALSNISQSHALHLSGWKTDSILNTGYESTCAGNTGNTWYGGLPNAPVGSIWTTFQGTGMGTLSFGNCHPTRGHVKAFLNEKAIAEATPLQRKEISFGYSLGDVLKIREYNYAIWKLYSFSVECN